MFLLYSLLFTLGVIATAPYYLWRLRGRVASWSDWRERFGFLPDHFQQAERGAIWVHAVSVGETLAAVELIRKIQRCYPERKIFLSHVTPAGREAGASRLRDVAGRFLLPLDWSACVRRAMARIRPALLVIVETELWPNLLRAANQAGAHVLVVNGRISDRSFPRYRLIRPFMRRVLANVDRICAQSETDAERFRTFGAPQGRVLVAGNLKFDAQPPQLGEFAQVLGQGLRMAERGPIIVAASTMPGEEERLLPAWSEVRRRHPRALWILAPRHPTRFDEVARLLADTKLDFVRRTALGKAEPQLTSQLAGAEVLLLDTIGELAGIFELADVVFVGGSLVPTGGHNILEPAYWGKPILFGPHMHNFRDVARLFLQSNAALQVPDAATLATTVLQLLDDSSERRRLGEAARRLLEEQRGACARVLAVMNDWLEAPVTTPQA